MDETTNDTNDKPLAHLADTERGLDSHVDAAEPDGSNATDRMRAFEDEHFGKDAVRIDGKIERGRGSKFSEMTEAQHRHYAAIEKMVVSEQRLADAHTALIDAEAAHQDAMAAVDKTEAEIDVPRE